MSLLSRLLGGATANGREPKASADSMNQGPTDGRAKAASVPFCKDVSENLARVVAMPLEQFADADLLLEIRVPWLKKTLWFVPTDRDVNALVADGVSRGRVWTANELAQLTALPDCTPDVVHTLAHVKLEVDGDIVGVLRAANQTGWPLEREESA